MFRATVTSVMIVRKLVADASGKTIPPFGRRHDEIVDDAVIGFGYTVLHFEELLAVDVRPGVFLAVDDLRLQCAIDLLERHFLRVRAELLELGNQHVGCLNAELQAIGIFGVSSGWFADSCFMPLCQKGKALKAAAAHGIFHGLAGSRILETVDGIDIGEHERKIEDAELLGELFEL